MSSFFRSFEKNIVRAIRRLSGKQRSIFILALLVFAATSLFFIAKLLNYNTLLLPARGGILHEGIVGTPRFINPLFASSDSELDLTRLIYSGLVRKIDEGDYIPDLAESFEVSPDGKTYTFHLRKNITFHDGAELNTDDVVFTIESIQNPTLKSPLAINWRGVSVKALDATTVVFNLSQPFAGFLDNATVGILPKHIWSEISEPNIVFDISNAQPIGSGPYTIQSIEQRNDGTPREYRLRAFSKFTLGKPFITHIYLSIFEDDAALEKAYEHSNLDAIVTTSFTTQNHNNRGTSRIYTRPFTRLFGLFFNTAHYEKNHLQKIPSLLHTLIDRQELIKNIYNGYASALSSPLPPYITENYDEPHTTENVARALSAYGFTFDTNSGMLKKSSGESLSIPSLSLVTGNAPYLIAGAEAIQKQLAKFGISIEITIYESEELTEEVLKGRNYDVLLFGQSIPHDTALYAFWHSSQRAYPGLNITQYVNSTTDELLEKALKQTSTADRFSSYRRFAEELTKDSPAVYLYTPDFVYKTHKNLQVQLPKVMTRSQDRWNQIYTWSLRQNRVWEALVKNS